MKGEYDMHVYSKAVRAKLRQLEKARDAAEYKVADIKQQIEELLVGQLPIKVGSRITWVSGNRERYGNVVSILTMYRGFQYRVEVTTKAGKKIGMATVNEDQQPSLRTE